MKSNWVDELFKVKEENQKKMDKTRVKDFKFPFIKKEYKNTENKTKTDEEIKEFHKKVDETIWGKCITKEERERVELLKKYVKEQECNVMTVDECLEEINKIWGS